MELIGTPMPSKILSFVITDNAIDAENNKFVGFVARGIDDNNPLSQILIMFSEEDARKLYNSLTKEFIRMKKTPITPHDI